MQQNQKFPQEIKSIDEEGNLWRIVLYPLTSKSNRFQLSFFFNEKEFELSKFQSNRTAQDLWDLLGKIRKGQPKPEENNKEGWVYHPSKTSIESIPCNNIEKEETIDEQQTINRSQ